jgi:PAS domain S-box-containing protein
MSDKTTSLEQAQQHIKTLENQIEEITTKNETLLNTLVDALILIDDRNLITAFNIAAVQLFGYQPEEVIGQNVKLLCPEPVRTEHDNYVARYVHTDHKHIVGRGREVTAERKDGSTFPILLSVSEMWLDGKRHFTGLIKDLTTQKEAERVKNEFISTVSHELRTPLTSIRGSLGLLVAGAGGKVSPQHKTLLNIAVNNTERLLLLINDILDIEKIEAGKLRFEFKRFDIVHLIQQTIDDDAGLAEEFDVQYQFHSDEPLIFINGDEGRIHQVINNLLSNAAKFSHPDGIIEIKTIQHNGLVRISIIDHGMGIDPKFMPQLFDKFTQADSTDIRRTAGSGLGLSISKAIIEKHQGKLFAESVLGQGSSFHIDLPTATADTIVGNISNQIITHGNILIVEDDPDIAELIKRMLTDAGCTCDIAYDTIQARDKLAKKHYDAMTLDLILPGQNGMDFIAELKRLGTNQNMPIVVISVDADSKNIKAEEFSSVVDWIQKPIDSNKLIAAVTASRAISVRDKPLILQVEDEADVQKVVGLILRDHADIMVARTLKEARALLEQHQFDLVLLDIGLPDGSGYDLLVELKAKRPPIKAVIFSAQDVGHDIAKEVSAALVKSRTSNLQLIQTIKAAIK